jgi:3-phosphoglycerate kinase
VREMMVSWHFGVALRMDASIRHMLRMLKNVVGTVVEMEQVEASGGDREGERERIVADVPKL